METGNNNHRRFNQIVNLIYNETLENIEKTKERKIILDKKITIKPKFIYDNIEENIFMETYIGIVSMHRINNLSEFLENMKTGAVNKYDDELEFSHIKENFTDESQNLLSFILKYAECIRYGNINSNASYRFGKSLLSESKIVLDKCAIDELFEILQEQTVQFEKDSEEKSIKINNKNLDIRFYLEKINKAEYVLLPNVDILKVNKVVGEKNTYILIENEIFKCSKEFENTTLKLIEALKTNYLSELRIGMEQLPKLFSIIIPIIKNNLIIKDEDKKALEQYLPQKLTSRIYLDFDNNNYLIANLRFIYDGVEFNPLEEKIKKQNSRDIIEETISLNILRKTGFMLDSKKLRFVLTDNEQIYNFINDEFDMYLKHFEILVTEKFNSKKTKQPRISTLGLKLENNLLEIDLKSLNIDTKELIEIIEKYRLKKKYHRLKDGTFLKLDDNPEMNFLSGLIAGNSIEYSDFETGVIHLPVYRTMYLNQLLEGLKETRIEKSEEFNNIAAQLNKDNINNNSDVQSTIDSVLRYYQKIGVKWLKTLDYYNFGGILADDMGLGKTIQLLAVITDYVEKKDDKTKKATIVISPSSLALNWENEAKKFTPNLKTMVIAGTSNERKKQIDSIDRYDLVITSYDLLKRDIDFYKEKNYKFKFIIADEAQYLKNSNTQNAIAIKQLQGETRYALTGTPMENSLSELWSIFDFIMPGYLFTHRNFKNFYEVPIVKEKDEAVMKKLKMLIEPFVLRRTKKEVLTELPDKTVTILTSTMQEEQKNIYLSYLMEAKQEVKDAIDINGLERSHMKILAVLTRLRQICCHPGVFIENYEGGSSKLEQCIELIKDGINSGHKILLFSGYTSIFPIIEKELEKQNIEYYKLTGATKVSHRINMVDEFNRNDKIKVFLISLKAGGTGINLTGADMVIHYDPWWNASAENQATDRAYRIGQKNNVQVYKLITKESIEEKIYQIQQRKSALIDNMLDINTSFVNKLSREEIMELFE